MQISSKMTIAGCSILEVRKFVRKHRNDLFSIGVVQNSFQLDLQSASKLMRELEKASFVQKSKTWNGYQLYKVANLGQALVNASASKPIYRKTADRILAQFLKRVHEVNATSEYFYWVNQVILFGSMLSGVERLSDVDVAINLQPKVSNDAEIEKWKMGRRHAAEAKGRSFYSSFERTSWPEKEIALHLKARSHSLSVHEISDVATIPDLRYQVLLGDQQQISALIPSGRAVQGLAEYETRDESEKRSGLKILRSLPSVGVQVPLRAPTKSTIYSEIDRQ